MRSENPEHEKGIDWNDKENLDFLKQGRDSWLTEKVNEIRNSKREFGMGDLVISFAPGFEKEEFQIKEDQEGPIISVISINDQKEYNFAATDIIHKSEYIELKKEKLKGIIRSKEIN